MSVYYGDFFVSGTGGAGSWVDPYKLGDLSTQATMEALGDGDELRIKGSTDADLYTDLAGTFILDPDDTKIVATNSQAGVVAADDVCYFPNATMLKWYPIYSVSTVNLNLNGTNYWTYNCLETPLLSGITGKVIKKFFNLAAHTYVIRYINKAVIVSFGWTADGTQDGNTCLFNKTGAYAMYLFKNTSNATIDLERLMLISINSIYFGSDNSTSGASTCTFSNRLKLIMNYKASNYIYNYLGSSPLRIDQAFYGNFYYNRNSYVPAYGSYNVDINLVGLMYNMPLPASISFNSELARQTIRIGTLLQGGSASSSNVRDISIQGGYSKIENIYRKDNYKININSLPSTEKCDIEIGNIKKLGTTTYHSVYFTAERSTLQLTRTALSATDADFGTAVYLKSGQIINSDLSTAPPNFNVYVDNEGDKCSLIKCKFPTTSDKPTNTIGNYGGTLTPTKYSRSSFIRDCLKSDDNPFPNTEILSICDGDDEDFAALCQLDSSVKRTSGSSLKLRLTWNNSKWYKKMINVKGVANKTTSVTAYMRKNSSYGSSNLPYIKLHWYDSNGVEQTSISTMTDVNDTWVKLDVSGIPATNGDLELEIGIYSISSSAIVYLDDINVVVS